MRCKPGEMAVVVKTNRHTTGCLGNVVTCVSRGTDVDGEPAWIVSPKQFSNQGMEIQLCEDSCLRPLRNNPGNESWFTAAPRSKPATTKQDTIDARWMVRS